MTFHPDLLDIDVKLVDTKGEKKGVCECVYECVCMCMSVCVFTGAYVYTRVRSVCVNLKHSIPLHLSSSLLLLQSFLPFTLYLFCDLVETREVFVENVTDVDIQYQLFYRTIFKPESGEVTSNR